MIKAIGNNIIVERIKPQEKVKEELETNILKELVGTEEYNCDSYGTLGQPEEPMQYKGVVVSVGEQIKKVKVGDSIIYKKWSSDPFKENGKEYQSVEEYGVIAVISKK